MNNEIWRNIPDYEGLYQISSFGNIRSLTRIIDGKRCKLTIKGRKLKPSIDEMGYKQIVLTKNGKRKSYKIHKIVANTFLNKNDFKSMPNEDKNLIELKYLQVNHKDENSLNNRVDNLEFCTLKYNCNYGTRNYRCTKHCFHKVNQYDGLFTLMNTYNSLKEAQEKTGIKYQNISSCCRGITHSAGGWIWRYADE